MFDAILLEDEQKALLKSLVEQSRSIPRAKHGGFRWHHLVDDDARAHYFHLGGPRGDERVHERDLEALARVGLLSVRRDGDGYGGSFDLTPASYRYYEFLQKEAGSPAVLVERAVLSYMENEGFGRRYPEAQSRWARASALLAADPTPDSLTTIGHLCREASQEFVTSLVEAFHIPDAEPDRAKTVARFRAVLKSFSGGVSPAVLSMLEALLSYFGTVLDLIQRQEHGGVKDGETLTWEDARRVVFQAGMTMYEIDRTLRGVAT